MTVLAFRSFSCDKKNTCVDKFYDEVTIDTVLNETPPESFTAFFLVSRRISSLML